MIRPEVLIPCGSPWGGHRVVAQMISGDLSKHVHKEKSSEILINLRQL